MDQYSIEERDEALQIVSSVIISCEKMQPKFVAGTSQHTLLKNRVKALYIAKSLIMNENIYDKYTKEELKDALRPITSIMNKCKKAQMKFTEGTSHHIRLRNMINAMDIARSLITDAINQRE